MKVWLFIIAFTIALSAKAADEGEATLEMQFRQLGKGANWQEVGTQQMGFQTFHPQGMTAVGDRFFLSSVEVVDRAKEQGIGHLFEMDRFGVLLRQTTLGEGNMYHPGGIDYDGKNIWVSVAEYRPNSASIVYAVSPDTLESREVFRFNDHLGAIAHFPERNLLVAVTWGARYFCRWETTEKNGQWIVLDPENPVMKPNGNHYMDYQDMQRIPDTPWLLCSGIQMYAAPEKRLMSLRLGGIDLVHVDQLIAHHQVPVPVRSPVMPAWTQNPFYVELVDKKLRFFFVPEDNKSSIYMLDVDN
jgi:hypothetical protein